jgi:hypothetical protein
MKTIDNIAKETILRIRNYAIWQAIHDLESHCRHRAAGRHQDWLQIESEDRASTPVIERALKCLEDCGVEIVRDPNYPNIRIVYDRASNENFGYCQ